MFVCSTLVRKLACKDCLRLSLVAAPRYLSARPQRSSFQDKINSAPNIPFSFPIAKYLVDKAPRSLQPYLRLIRADKPIGTWLLYWPCTWSIALATETDSFPDPGLLALFLAGAFFMRSAGCIVNDLWDRDFDRKVERTKNRPLASGELSTRQAVCTLAGMLSVSLAILLQLNWYSVIVGASSLALVLTYPLAKRYTYWPQVVLGITLNWGVLISWIHLNGVSLYSFLPVIPLYVACVFHTLIYDTIYSHQLDVLQDKADDIMVGVKSTALRFGNRTQLWLSGFASAMIGCLSLTGIMCDLGKPFYLLLVFPCINLMWQISTLKINNPEDCWEKFRTNHYLGAAIFFTILLGKLSD